MESVIWKTGTGLHPEPGMDSVGNLENLDRIIPRVQNGMSSNLENPDIKERRNILTTSSKKGQDNKTFQTEELSMFCYEFIITYKISWIRTIAQLAQFCQQKGTPVKAHH
ncbi:hypothetical protein TURU_056370 [Turdus rufiventris]|nr:hypothetical protein TURU_056370 [Turdus rufiventris]